MYGIAENADAALVGANSGSVDAKPAPYKPYMCRTLREGDAFSALREASLFKKFMHGAY